MKAAASPFGQDHLRESWARGRDEFKAPPRQGLSKLESTSRLSRLNTFFLLSWESKEMRRQIKADEWPEVGKGRTSRGDSMNTAEHMA